MSESLIYGETDLTLPDRLLSLICNGVWPTSENSQRQNLKPIYRNKKAYKDRFEMATLYLYPPPFQTVHGDLASDKYFWTDKTLCELFGQPLIEGIEPAESVILGDFGQGTDAVLLLDYQINKGEPRILGMDYGDISNTKGWAVLANDFNEFCDHIGLP